jgi:UDP-N-acetylglucosamine--N-acetylmuramyl-(pentapeptide) pyrophosphoryl-undecaprenol N-acetylglucosamine transferase
MTLFFTSPIGLGHASRDIAIAEKLKSVHNEILFVSGAWAFNLISKNGYSAFNLYKPINFYIHSGELKKYIFHITKNVKLQQKRLLLNMLVC